MTTPTFGLAPEPVWVLINLVGTVAGGGYIVTKESLDKVVDKPIFVDPSGLEPWPNPTYFDLNGVQGPFYWEFDPGNPDDTYFVQAYDADGNLLWEVDGFGPSSGGGGSVVTTYLPLVNYIANNVFIDNSNPVAVATNITNYVVCPSNHKGFTPALLNPVLTAYGTVGPDIRFNKNNTGIASDQITYPLFPLASPALDPDVTPVYCIEYQCTGSPAGETFKNFQFPICQKVKNLSNQIMTFAIWAKAAATPTNLTLYTLQYYGSGTGATAPVRSNQGTIALTTSWKEFVLTITIPDVAAGSVGIVGQQTDDDALYIQLGLPLGTACDVLFTKPSLYLGVVNPTEDFATYDQIDSIDQTFRTGDIKTSLSSSAPNGWVPMNDTSIGNVGSGATNRANKDTFQLYKTIWDGVLDAWAPVSTGRGATAIADFIADKTLTLPRSLGRALSGAGSGSGLTPTVLGQYQGVESYQLGANNLPVHTHAATSPNQAYVEYRPGSGSFGVGSGGANNYNTATQTGPNTTTNDAFSIIQPVSYFNVFIKL